MASKELHGYDQLPKRYVKELQEATKIIYDNVKALKADNANDLLASLSKELSQYIRIAKSYLERTSLEDQQDPHNLWEFWKSQRLALPCWFGVATILVLIQPSSAFNERCFSLVKASTKPTQNGEYEETFQGRALAICNQH